ncbi:hypothetical protein V1512DRAFT_281435 [Lipomyces arxii]|uniref:uncharacterized protein n=1 Tax=Lipomyces arxii TaxID=56418 RepID=UPI0034CE72A8
MLAEEKAVQIPPVFVRSRQKRRKLSSSIDGDYTRDILSESCTEKETVQSEESMQVNPTWGGLYIDAFMSALNTVLEHESYLFDENELEIFEQFKNLQEDAKRLYVRLFLRKRNKWFRLNQMQYKEINDTMSAFTSLVDTGFAKSIDTSKDMTIEVILNLFSVSELKALAKDLNFKGIKGTKSDIISDMIIHTKNQSCLDWSSTGLSLLYDQKGFKQNHMEALLVRCLQPLGACVMLNDPQCSVFERVHLVYFRARQLDEKLLSIFVLAKTSKRNYTDYLVCRSTEVFKTKSELLEYEQALQTQLEVDLLFDGNDTSRWEIAKCLLEPLYDHWNEIVSLARRYDGDRDHYLIRFSAAWVYTRLMYKYAYVLCRLGLHRYAHEVYTALLEQRIYQRGKRGDWYQRRALIEMMYMCEEKKDAKEKRHWKLQALLTCEKGLQDPDTHLMYYYDLQKRIVRLENDMRVLPKDRHDFRHMALKEPLKRTFYGTQISETEIGRKTVWLDLENNECSVEEMCLSNYKALGWKGFHTEGGILRTIFAYLFWDIIFLPVPYVFETEFQSAPLDLDTDAFYLSRSGEINCRLAEIENGAALNLVQSVYDRESARETQCVGLDWSFPLQDVLEAVECIGGCSLAAICKVFAEDYSRRTAGMPDLFLWRTDSKTCMFSEVKSENDRLSDAQRLWIDVLVVSGVVVELCAGLKTQNEVKNEL